MAKDQTVVIIVVGNLCIRRQNNLYYSNFIFKSLDKSEWFSELMPLGILY